MSTPYCSACGHPTELRTPPEDTRPRSVCTHCESVAYENPKIVTGCLAFHGDRLLLARRATEPRRGYWSPPAGFLELGETAEEGAARETFEECGVHVQVGALHTMLNVTCTNQVYLFFFAELDKASCVPGPESLEARLFACDEVPWQSLTYTAIGTVIFTAFEQWKQTRQTHDSRLPSDDAVARSPAPANGAEIQIYPHNHDQRTSGFVHASQ